MRIASVLEVCLNSGLSVTRKLCTVCQSICGNKKQLIFSLFFRFFLMSPALYASFFFMRDFLLSAMIAPVALMSEAFLGAVLSGAFLSTLSPYAPVHRDLSSWNLTDSATVPEFLGPPESTIFYAKVR